MKGNLLRKAVAVFVAVSIAFAVIAVLKISSRASGDVVINETNFPDLMFRLYVKETFDNSPRDNKLSSSEIEAAKSIIILNNTISDMKGIEFFSSLEKLETRHGDFTELDLSNNSKLREVTSQYGKLEKIDLSGCADLERLSLAQNKIAFIDLSYNTKLKEAELNNNELTSVNVNGCEALERLDLYTNKLTEIDLTANTSLVILDCGNNGFVKMDITNNKGLSELWIDNNPLEEIDISNNGNILDAYQNGKEIDQVYKAGDSGNGHKVYQKDEKRFSIDPSVTVNTGDQVTSEVAGDATFLDHIKAIFDADGIGYLFAQLIRISVWG